MFDKTKQAVHTKDEVDAETKDLKTEEDTSTDAGQSVDNETESGEETPINDDVPPAEDISDDTVEEEVVTLKKSDYEKMVSDKENYKQGMIAAKAKKRTLVTDVTDKPQVEVSEAVVYGVLEKQTEKSALRNTIDSKHADFIPELVDDASYQEIISYIPRSMDKGDYHSIVKSLKIATRMWKEDKGIKDTAKTVKTVPTSKTTGASGASTTPKKDGRKFFKKSTGMQDWYKD